MNVLQYAEQSNTSGFGPIVHVRSKSKISICGELKSVFSWIKRASPWNFAAFLIDKEQAFEPLCWTCSHILGLTTRTQFALVLEVFCNLCTYICMYVGRFRRESLWCVCVCLPMHDRLNRQEARGPKFKPLDRLPSSGFQSFEPFGW